MYLKHSEARSLLNYLNNTLSASHSPISEEDRANLGTIQLRLLTAIPDDEERLEQFYEAAKDLHSDLEDTISFDDLYSTYLSEGGGGCHVSCWVWVSNEDAGIEEEEEDD